MNDAMVAYVVFQDSRDSVITVLVDHDELKVRVALFAQRAKEFFYHSISPYGRHHQGDSHWGFSEDDTS